jgi:hypothetical protein
VTTVGALRRWRDRSLLRVLARLPPAHRFAWIWRLNLWGGRSRSGTGSDPEQTRVLERELPALLERHAVTSLLDVPCGDHGWMSRVDLGACDYIGADIVAPLVRGLQRRHAGPRRRFVCLDATRDVLPRADLVLCRDLLVHLPDSDVLRVLANVRRSGARLLLTTSFPAQGVQPDIMAGDWRPLDLERAPFGLGPPLDGLHENCREAAGRYADKSLLLWPTTRLPS